MPSDDATALLHRLTTATAGISGPVAAVDLDRFDANVAELRARAAGRPVRLASKSVRVRSLQDRALAAGMQGTMAYSLAEALWLVGHGGRDILVAYPTVDAAALADLVADSRAIEQITLMVDDEAQLRLIAEALARGGWHPGDTRHRVRVCIDVDASLRIDLGFATVHLGTRRSPLWAPERVAAVAHAAAAIPGVRVRGIMTYEAQVAGLPDTSAAVRLVKRLSVATLRSRRVEVLDAVRAAVGHDVDLVNAGGTGSLELSAAAPAVTEVTAGSGLFAPGLFDGYRAFAARPSAFFGLDIVRLPAPGYVTAFSGGYVASGPAARSRLPRVATPGWALTGREGAGEVQTPLRAVRVRGAVERWTQGGGSADVPRIGDRIWFRHAKAGELMERFDRVHLVRGAEVVDVVPTYRGEGRNFG